MRGQTESVALSKADKRMITGTFSGYIEAGYSGNANGNTFNFTVNGVSRFFLVKSINDPREKGDFANVELEVVSLRKSRTETSLPMNPPRMANLSRAALWTAAV